MIFGKGDISKLACAAALLCALAVAVPTAPVQAATRQMPGRPLSRADNTPFAPSTAIVGAGWTSPRYDPPPNQSGDILPTVWSEDGGTYVLMDDGGVDVPLPRGIWRQSFARISGRPPHLRFEHVGDPTSPPPHTGSQIGGNRDRDSGPLGPYYSIGFLEAGGTFYDTLQRNWNWGRNGLFTGLTGIAYSRDHGGTWHIVRKSFPAPLGNLNFVDGGGPGGSYPDGYVYAIGTEREFNASRLVLGRVRPEVANITDPSRWQWFAGAGAGQAPVWSSGVAAARPVAQWNGTSLIPRWPTTHRCTATC